MVWWWVLCGVVVGLVDFRSGFQAFEDDTVLLSSNHDLQLSLMLLNLKMFQWKSLPWSPKSWFFERKCSLRVRKETFGGGGDNVSKTSVHKWVKDEKWAWLMDWDIICKIVCFVSDAQLRWKAKGEMIIESTLDFEQLESLGKTMDRSFLRNRMQSSAIRKELWEDLVFLYEISK